MKYYESQEIMHPITKGHMYVGVAFLQRGYLISIIIIIVIAPLLRQNDSTATHIVCIQFCYVVLHCHYLSTDCVMSDT